MVTLQDVADACGVSRGTVSRALRGLSGVGDALRDEITRSSHSLGYRPNRAAQALRNQRSQLVGVILTNMTNASFQRMVEVVQHKLDSRDYDMLLGVSGGDEQQEQRLLRTFFDRGVDGIMMFGSNGLVPLSPVLRDLDVPTVHVIRRLDPQPADSLLGDDRRGAFEATQHLLVLGHRRIGLIVGGPDTRAGNERRIGYLDALKASGVRPDRSLVCQGPYRPFTGARAIGRLFNSPQPPSALFIANHEAAFGALPALVQRGVEVPKQLSVIVYEDAPWFAYWTPPLTVVDNNPARIAEQAVALLLERLDERAARPARGRHQGGGSHARLIERGSCAGPANDATPDGW